jgi:F0F1-type ATP synthase assembly protein I
VSKNDADLESAARLTGLVGQIGCVTGFVSILIVGAAFAVGRFLDSTLGTGGIFTVLFMIGSFPITLYAIVRISLASLKRAQKSQSESKNTKIESHSEEETEIS